MLVQSNINVIFLSSATGYIKLVYIETKKNLWAIHHSTNL